MNQRSLIPWELQDNMTKQSIYPTRRQKAFFESCDVGVEQFHLVTSASIMYFKHTFKLIILIYAVLAFISGFELLSGVLVESVSIQSKIVAPSMAGLMLVLLVAMGMIHNQILLILGHGYKSREAQLYVDRLTTNEECRTSLTIIRSMYVIAIVIPVVLLWFIWGMYGTPFYGGQFGDQMGVVSAISSAMTQGAEVQVANSTQLLKPYLWAGSFGLLCAFLSACLGWMQVTLAKSKV